MPAWLARRSHQQGTVVRQGLGTLHADILEGVQGLRDLVTLGYGPRYLARLGCRMAGLRSAHLAYGRRTGAEQAAAELIIAAATGFTLWTTITMIGDGSLAPEYFAVIVLLVSAMLGPVAALVGALGALGRSHRARETGADLREYRDLILEEVISF